MLWFSSNKKQIQHGDNTYNKDQICIAVSEMWQLADDLGDIGAEQTGFGWETSEYACHISDAEIADQVGSIGAKQTAMGMDVSESASVMEKTLKTIAEAHGCKFTPRPYG